MESVLTVAIIIDEHDETTMMVGRRTEDDCFEILNVLQGEEALDIYDKLIGEAYE